MKDFKLGEEVEVEVKDKLNDTKVGSYGIVIERCPFKKVKDSFDNQREHLKWTRIRWRKLNGDFCKDVTIHYTKTSRLRVRKVTNWRKRIQNGL
jgi:hypothetical protein